MATADQEPDAGEHVIMPPTPEELEKAAKEETLRQLEQIARAPLELSPLKVPVCEPISPKLPPLVLDWAYKDPEVVRAKYLKIARLIVRMYYSMLNSRNETLLRLFVRPKITNLVDSCRIVRDPGGTVPPSLRYDQGTTRACHIK